MTNKEKLEALKAFLKENDVKFIENHRSNFGVTMDLKLPDLMIAVFLSDGKNEGPIFESGNGHYKMKYFYKPFFIRETETVDFVIEKMKNSITDQMLKAQQRFEKEERKKENIRLSAESQRIHEERVSARMLAEKPKRRRVRIQHYEKVEPRRKDV